MMDTDDYQVGDEWDWDTADPRQHCKHGTFIGSWWGPDVLCGYCEDGVTDEDFARYVEENQRRAMVRWGQEIGKRVVHHLFTTEAIVIDGNDPREVEFATHLITAIYGVTIDDVVGITDDDIKSVMGR